MCDCSVIGGRVLAKLEVQRWERPVANRAGRMLPTRRNPQHFPEVKLVAEEATKSYAINLSNPAIHPAVVESLPPKLPLGQPESGRQSRPFQSIFRHGITSLGRAPPRAATGHGIIGRHPADVVEDASRVGRRPAMTMPTVAIAVATASPLHRSARVGDHVLGHIQHLTMDWYSYASGGPVEGL